MELSAKYNASEVEDKWYAYWLENKFFHSEPDGREPYTIVIPPPNVTGILHMGHVLNNTLNDVLIRKARMDGKNACWVPGTDHASIATESKVVAKLKGMGISKEDLTREEFLKYAWEWKEEHGGIILKQLRKLGASCDWDRTRFTMEPALSEAVINTFVYFYKKGWIYRGVRMVNWDPEGHTAVSDDEVIHKDTQSHFYHMRYFISDGHGNPTDKYIVVATTRPETIMADAAICVNPTHQQGDTHYRGRLCRDGFRYGMPQGHTRARRPRLRDRYAPQSPDPRYHRRPRPAQRAGPDPRRGGPLRGPQENREDA